MYKSYNSASRKPEKSEQPPDENRKKDIEELVRAAQQGDAEAERLFLEELRVRFIKIATQKVWDRREELKDAIQDALITIVTKYKDQKFEKFLAYAYKVLEFKITNLIKKRQDLPLPEERLLPPAPDDSEEDLAYLIFVEDLKTAIATLGRVCKKIFAILIGGGSRRDLQAAFSRMAENTLDVNVHRCRKKLKDELRKRGYDL